MLSWLLPEAIFATDKHGRTRIKKRSISFKPLLIEKCRN